MSKKCQARVVEACVESSLLYDCQATEWPASEANASERSEHVGCEEVFECKECEMED